MSRSFKQFLKELLWFLAVWCSNWGIIERVNYEKNGKLGTVKRTSRGFELVEFKDRYQASCSLQASTLYQANEKPGASAVWIGIDDAKPQVMDKDAAKVGIVTEQKTGWVDYPIPEQVLLHTHIHLDR